MAKSDQLKPPPSPTFRALVSSGFGLIIAIPLGIWVNLITATRYVGLMALFFNYQTFALGAGLVLIAANLALVRRWDIQEREWNRVTGITQAQHTLSVQRRILSTYCMILKGVLGCNVSARIFDARNEEGEVRLYQVRDVFIENEYFPQETAYTYVPVTHPDFIHCRSFRERAPMYEILPVDHVENYPVREKTMVEPSQRWVLAAPIQRLDESGMARDELQPRGVVVFYGRTDPEAVPGSKEGDLAKTISRDAAEAFVFMSLGTAPPSGK
jgi:hypothetical protein